eukprot:767887-Hanusia_phi.AAC.7
MSRMTSRERDFEHPFVQPLPVRVTLLPKTENESVRRCSSESRESRYSAAQLRVAARVRKPRARREPGHAGVAAGVRPHWHRRVGGP